MIGTTVGLGAFLSTLAAVAYVNRAPLARGLATVRGGVRHMVHGRITDEPGNYVYQFFINVWVPRQRRADEAIASRQRQSERAAERRTGAEEAFHGHVPDGDGVLRALVPFAFWVFVVIAVAVLDWSLNYAFSGSAWVATILTVIMIVLGVLLAIGVNMVRTRWAGWDKTLRGNAALAIVLLYVALLVFSGVLGWTRADWAYEKDVAAANSAYATEVSVIQHDVNLAELEKAEHVADNAGDAQLEYDQQKIEAQAQRLQEAADTRDTRLEILANGRSWATAKWVAFAVIASALEAALSYSVNGAVKVLWLLFARRATHQAREQEAKAIAARERVVDRLRSQLARRLVRAGVGLEILEPSLAAARARCAVPLAATGAEGAAAVPGEDDRADDRRAEGGDAEDDTESPADSDLDDDTDPDGGTPADGPTPGFDEA
jgi:hypothetical protein